MSSASHSPARSRVLLCAAALILTIAFVAETISPSWAATDAPTAIASALVDDVSLGGEVTGRIDERSGALTVEVPLGGLTLRWDSQMASTDRAELGPGWDWAGLGHVDVRGGVRAFPPAGGVYEAAASSPTGLLDYTIADVHFSQAAGTLPARDDALVGPRPYGFTLSELGGTTTSFDVSGNPLARADPFGNRTDWAWTPGTHLLERRIDPVGVVSRVDRSDPGMLTVTTSAGSAVGATSEIELDGGRVSAVRDAVGARTAFGYARDGRLTRVLAPSGAVTDVRWQRAPDGTVAVDLVRVADASSGEVVTSRQWRAVEGSASGWPLAQDTREASGPVGASLPRYATYLGDGTTGVESSYSPTHLLVEREVSTGGPSGRTLLSRHTLDYPIDPDIGDVPGRFSRPTEATTTWFSDSGAERSVVERHEYDEQGRVTRHTAGDGTVTEVEYDRERVDGRPLPTGLPLTERTTAPDGIVSERRYELTPERTAVAAMERFHAEPGEPEPTRTGRTEFDVAPDGFVTAEREFPQGGDGVPVVTTRARHLDSAAGTQTIEETRAAGTTVAAATVRVTDLVHGARLASTDEVGNRTTYELDSLGRELARTEPSGLRHTTAYRVAALDGANAVTTTRADGLATTEHHDVIGRAVRVTDNLSAGHPADGHTRVVETREYPDATTETVTDAWGATTRIRRDALGRVVETSLPGGLVEVTAYDDAANTRTTGRTPTGRIADAELTVTETMNARGDVTREGGVRADGQAMLTRDHAYDGLGRIRSVGDGVSTTTTAFDVHGNPETTTIAPAADDGATASTAVAPAADAASAGPVTVSRTFDAIGTTVEQTRTRDGESRSGGVRVLDELGRTTLETDQAGRTSRSEYTADGLLARRTTAYGQVTEHTYDQATRRLTQTVTTSPIGATVRTAFEYDPVLGTVSAVFDPTDREHTEIATEHDAHGNPTRVTYPDGSTIEHRYDDHGRGTGTTDVAGATTSLAYDDAGRVTEVVQRGADGAELARARSAYDPFGRVTALTRGNGVVTTFAYTSAGQASREHTTDASGTTLADRSYAYDPRGNLVRRADLVRNPHGGARAGELVATTTTHRYDAYDQLIGSAVVEGAYDGQPPPEASVVSRVEYATSVGGDLRRERTETRPGTAEATSVERRYDYTPTGELIRISTVSPAGHEVAEQVYDAAGNLVVAADGTRYTYNAANRVVHEASPEGRAIATAYWADGRRAELSTPEQSVPELSVREPERGASAVTRFYWDGATLLNDVHTRGGNGAAADEQAVSYLMGAGRLARTVTGGVGAGSGTSYTIHDRHGNITALTDAGGAVTERYAYDDYGVTSVERPETPTPEPYAWQVGDATANPFAYAGEYTDPTGTQYLQARTYDPAIRAFTTADTEPLHNRYAFADLNPVMRVDPTGRSSDLDWGDIMQDSRVKIVNTVLAVLLTIMGFVGMNGLFNGATLSYIVGFWGGLASSLVQAAGTAMLTIDTINSLVDRPFFDPETAGKVQFSGNVVSTIGAIGSSIFKLVRKRGTNQNRAKEKKLQEQNTELIDQKANLTKSNAKLSADHETMTQERDKLTAALRAIDPNHPLLPKPPGAPGSGAPGAIVPPQPVGRPVYAATSHIMRAPDDPLPTMSRRELDGIPKGAWEAGGAGS